MDVTCAGIGKAREMTMPLPASTTTWDFLPFIVHLAHFIFTLDCIKNMNIDNKV